MASLLAIDAANIWLAVIIGAGFGIASAAHCAGMCGAFPLGAIYGAKTWRTRLARASLYNGARGFTYICLGLTAAVIGYGTGEASGLADAGMGVVRVLSVLSAVVIAITGLFMLGVRIPFLRAGHGGKIADKVAEFGRSLMRSKKPFAPAAIGVLNGLLPCPLVYGMLVLAFLTGASQSGGMLAGAALSVGFALGTLPMMMGIAIAGGPILAKMKPRVAKIAGVFLLMLAVGMTFMRGFDINALHTILPQAQATAHFHEDDDGSHLHGGDDRIGELIPGAENMAHATLVDGVWIFMGSRPSGMSDEAYDALHQAEVEREKAKREVLALSPAEQRAKLEQLDAELAQTLIDTQGKAIEGKRCFTLTEADIAAIKQNMQGESKFEYRCLCCGTVRGMSADYVYEGLTLVFDEDQANPWSESGDE